MVTTHLIRATAALAICAAAPLAAEPAEDAGDGPALAFPSIYGAASAFPSPGGTGFVGLTLVYPRRDLPAGSFSLDRSDGDIVAGYTIGNPIDSISATLTIAITSLTDAFADSGALGVDLSRALFVTDDTLTFLGVTASNLAAWGDAALDPEAYEIYVSHLFSAPSPRTEIPVQVTLGYGDRTTYDDNGDFIEAGWFYGLGFGVTEHLSASVSGTRTQVNAGLVLGLDALPNWSFSAGVFDLADTVGRRQVALTVSRGF